MKAFKSLTLRSLSLIFIYFLKKNVNKLFNSIQFNFIHTYYNEIQSILLEEKKLNVQSNLFSDFTFYGRSA